jgi:hypothetical protein
MTPKCTALLVAAGMGLWLDSPVLGQTDTATVSIRIDLAGDNYRSPAFKASDITITRLGDGSALKEKP